MLVSIFATTIFFLAGIGRAVNTDRKNCENGPWIPPTYAGVDWAGTPDNYKFCEAGYSDGDLLTGIKVWSADWAVWGMSFRWGDHDYGQVYGTDMVATDQSGNYMLGDPATAEWNASLPVSIEMWHNKGKSGSIDAVGWIRVTVNGEQKLDVGSKHTDNQVSIRNGTGLVLALGGAAGNLAGNQEGEYFPISTLQFYFLESKIASAALTEIKFNDTLDAINAKKTGVEGTLLSKLYVENADEVEGGLNQTWQQLPRIEKDRSRTLSSSKTNTIGATLGVETKVEAGVPGLIESGVTLKAEARYDLSTMVGEEWSQSDKFVVGWSQGSVASGIPPQTAAVCTATATMGTFNSPYTAIITVKLDNGKTFNFNDAGKYQSVTFADARSSCDVVPISEIPPDAVKLDSTKRAVQFRG